MTRNKTFTKIKAALRKISPQEWEHDENAEWLMESQENAYALLRHWQAVSRETERAKVNAHNTKMAVRGLKALKAPADHMELAYINETNAAVALRSLTKLRDATKHDFHRAVGL